MFLRGFGPFFFGETGMEEPPRKRGRPPGAKNKKPPKLPRKSARVEARKREAKAAKPKRPARPPVHEAQAEIVLPGEEFGSRPAREDDSDAPNGQWALVFPRPRGRPKGSGALLKCDEPTLHKIWDVALRQCSQADVAVALGVSRETLGRFFEAHPVAREVYDDARLAGQGSLRAELFRQALSGDNTPALLFASKHYLGMTDRPKELDNPTAKLKEALNEFGAAISEKYLAFLDKEKAG